MRFDDSGGLRRSIWRRSCLPIQRRHEISTRRPPGSGRQITLRADELTSSGKVVVLTSLADGEPQADCKARSWSSAGSTCRSSCALPGFHEADAKADRPPVSREDG